MREVIYIELFLSLNAQPNKDLIKGLVKGIPLKRGKLISESYGTYTWKYYLKDTNSVSVISAIEQRLVTLKNFGYIVTGRCYKGVEQERRAFQPWR